MILLNCLKFGWMKQKKSEPNDPNALSLATSNKNSLPSVRMVLLKEFNQNGFVFYTNLNSQKGNELKENPNAAMCFHWKSLLRQIRISGTVSQVEDKWLINIIIQEVMRAELELGHQNKVKN